MGKSKKEQQAKQRVLLTTTDYFEIAAKVKKQERADMAVAKTWLSRAFRINERIRITEQNIELWKELANKVTSNPSEVAGAGNNIITYKTGKKNEQGEDIRECVNCNGRVDRWGTTIVDAVRENEANLVDLINIRREIEWAVSFVTNTTYRMLLQERYLLYKDWETIAKDMSYDIQHVSKHLHYKSLKAISYWIKQQIEKSGKST